MGSEFRVRIAKKWAHNVNLRFVFESGTMLDNS